MLKTKRLTSNTIDFVMFFLPFCRDLILILNVPFLLQGPQTGSLGTVCVRVKEKKWGLNSHTAACHFSISYLLQNGLIYMFTYCNLEFLEPTCQIVQRQWVIYQCIRFSNLFSPMYVTCIFLHWSICSLLCYQFWKKHIYMSFYFLIVEH